MKLFGLSILLLQITLSLAAAPIDGLLKDARDAETRQDSNAALIILEKIDQLQPNDPVTLQRIARQYSDLAPGQSSSDEKKRFAALALEYSERAVALAPRNAVNVLSLAISYGRIATYSDARTKVKYSTLIRTEAERARDLDPNYSWTYYVLGRWHCEVATLGFASRVFVKLFYGGLPGASVAEGVRLLKKATELEPGELNHFLELGFAFVAAGDDAAARQAWNHGLSMLSRGPHDDAAMERARSAMARLDR